MRHRNRTDRHDQALRRIRTGIRPDPQRRAGNGVRKLLNLQLRGVKPVPRRGRRVAFKRTTVEESAARRVDAAASREAVRSERPKKKGVGAMMFGAAKRLLGMNRARGG